MLLIEQSSPSTRLSQSVPGSASVKKDIGDRSPVASSPRKQLRSPRHKLPAVSINIANPKRKSADEIAVQKSEPFTSRSVISRTGAATLRERIADSQLDHQYMPTVPVSVDEVFYGIVPIGQQLENDIEYGHSELSFNIHHPETFVVPKFGIGGDGLRLYINTVIKHFLLNSAPREITQGVQRLFAVEPYSVRFDKRGRHRSYTLFKVVSPTDVIATREDYKLLQNSIPPVGLQSEPAATLELGKDPITAKPSVDILDEGDDIHDYDYLDKWRDMGDDEILPPLGDSGSEGGYDSDTWQEMQVEAEEAQNREKGTLSRDEVLAAIELGVADLVEKWKLEKLPKREFTAWKEWRKSRRLRNKKLQIRKAEAVISRIDNDRLPRIKSEIATQIWKTTTQVLKQCRIMEQNIFDREDALWLISNLSKKSEPERPPPQAKPEKRKAPRVSDLPDDEELLESGSEPPESTSEDNGGDTFIIEDEVPDVRLQGYSDGGTDADDENAMDLDVESSEDEIKASSSRRTMQLPKKIMQDGPLFSISESSTMNDRSTPQMSSPDRLAPRNSPQLGQSGKREVIDLTLSSDPSAAEDGDQKFEFKTPPINKSDVTYNPFRDPNDTQQSDKPSDDEPSSRTSASEVDQSKEVDKSLGKTKKMGRPRRSRHQPEEGSYEEEVFPWMDREWASIKLNTVSALEEKGDRNRLLVKLLDIASSDLRQALLDLVNRVAKNELLTDVWNLLEKLIRNWRNRIPATDTTPELIWKVAGLFLSWFECKRRRIEDGWPEKIILQVLHVRTEALEEFYRIFRKALCKYASEKVTSMKRYESPSGSENFAVPDHPDSSDSLNDSEVLKDSPHKKRKRPVAENLQAKSLREDDRQRRRLHDTRKLLLQKKLESMGGSLTENPERIVINTGKSEDEDMIYIDPHIGRRIKKHQIDGVQFMWREIVMDQKSQQGCLLAHEMGLGKTMQV